MYGLWRLEDEAVRRYHRQCESLECREDALRVRERRLDQVAEGFPVSYTHLTLPTNSRV